MMRFYFVFLSFFLTTSLLSQELKQVSLQLLWKHQFQFAGYYMAKEKGYYNDIGLDVQFKEFNNTIDVTKNVSNQKSQYGIARASVLIDISKGKDIMLLATIFQSSPLVLLSDKSRKINKIEDINCKKRLKLTGSNCKKIMTTGDLSNDVSLLSMIYSKDIVDEDLIVQKPSFNPKDLLDGETDLIAAYISNEPFVLKELGGDPVIFNPKDYGFDFPSDILFTSNQYLQKNKKEVEDFKNASLKGWKYAFSNLEESIEIIYKKYNTQNKSKEALLYEAKELKKLTNHPNVHYGYTDSKRLEFITQIYRLMGLIKNDFSLDQFIYTPVDKSTSQIYLTAEEKSWLEQNKVIKFTGDPDWLPFERFTSNNKYKGIVADHLKLIEERIGIKFTRVKPENWNDAVQKAVKGEVDFISGDKADSVLNKHLKFVDSYIDNKLILVMKKKEETNFISDINTIKDKKIAYVSGYGYTSDIIKSYPDIKFQEVATIQEGLEKVAIGELDALLCTLTIGLYNIAELGLSNLEIAGKTDIVMKLSFAVRKDWVTFQNILNKAIDSITADESRAIKQSWLGSNYNEQLEVTDQGIFEVSFVGMLTTQEILFSIVLSLFIAFFVFLFLTQRKMLDIRFKRFNILIIAFELAMISFLVYELIILDRTENKLAKMYDNKIQMLKVAEELRQSSDDLTHFARTYAVTGDEKFKQRYLDTLKIRNGTMKRPLNYDGIYWDLEQTTRELLHPFDKKTSLREMFNTLPFTKKELEKLKTSEDNSNELVNLEIKAFEAIQEGDNKHAVYLLHSPEYYKAKHNIMLPIDEMFTLLNERTTSETKMLNQKIHNQFTFIIMVGILFILGNIVIYILLRRKVSIPIEYLAQTIDKIQHQEKDIVKKSFYKDEIGETIDQFFLMKEQIDLQILKINSQKEFTQTLLDSQDQIIITSDGEQLLNVNKKFMDFYKVTSKEEFYDTYNCRCMCDTFDTDAPKEYLQKEMDSQMWIDYIITRPNQFHKAQITLNGEIHIFSITAALLPGESGIKLAVFTDITILERIKNDIESILSNIMLPILITSKDKREIIYANKYAEYLYEASAKELIGHSIDVIYTTKERQESVLKQLNEEGYVENREEKLKTMKGKEFYSLLSISPISYQNQDAYIRMTVDITKQKLTEKEIRALHKHTKESIEYASMIQGALIPEDELFRKYFKEYFTIWEPKDIVGGDIYLFEELRDDDECLLLIIDCTGHGVPGAFVTMLVKAIERQVAAIIASDPNMEVSPAWILQYFNKTMKKLLKQDNDNAISNAGFDGAAFYYNKKENFVKFAGAEIPLYYIQNNQLNIIKGDRHSIGYKQSKNGFEFTEHRIEIKDETKFYLTSDGYLDQLGGEYGFSLGKSSFEEMLGKTYKQSFQIQKERLLEQLKVHQGNKERTDDITMVGIKVDKTDTHLTVLEEEI